MSEEKGSLSANMNERNDISEPVEAQSTELQFRCPECGGDQLSYGVKSYQKAIINEDGKMDFCGGDSFGEKDVDFACWNCGHVICVDDKPIRRAEDMARWLKAHVQP
ncbi:MAG: hypothetical protein V1792_09655 [Pseudomonadota bacterium]